MITRDLSICFHTNKVEVCKDFYTKYLGGVVNFDCGWYINVTFNGDHSKTLQFMIPQSDLSLFGEKGITLNFKVDNVDSVYERLVLKEGLKAITPLKDEPWGCRVFTIQDPLGNILYIYSDIEFSEEYAKYHK